MAYKKVYFSLSLALILAGSSLSTMEHNQDFTIESYSSERDNEELVALGQADWKNLCWSWDKPGWEFQPERFKEQFIKPVGQQIVTAEQPAQIATRWTDVARKTNPSVGEPTVIGFITSYFFPDDEAKKDMRHGYIELVSSAALHRNLTEARRTEIEKALLLHAMTRIKLMNPVRFDKFVMNTNEFTSKLALNLGFKNKGAFNKFADTYELSLK